MKESQIERYMVRKVRECGGLCYKFTSPGNPGVPDRIVITPAGKTIYVELKTDVGRLAKVQKWQRAEMEKRGADVRVLFGMEAVKDFLREVFGDGKGSEPENLMVFPSQKEHAAFHAAQKRGDHV